MQNISERNGGGRKEERREEEEARKGEGPVLRLTYIWRTTKGQKGDPSRDGSCLGV